MSRPVLIPLLPALLLALASATTRAAEEGDILCQPLALDCLSRVAGRLDARQQVLTADLQRLSGELAALDRRLAHRASLIDSNETFLGEGRRLYRRLEDLPMARPGPIRFLGQDYQDRAHLKAQLAGLFDEQARLRTAQSREQAVREQLALQQSQWRIHLQAIQDYRAELPRQREVLENLDSLRQRADELEQQRQRFEDALGDLYGVIE